MFHRVIQSIALISSSLAFLHASLAFAGSCDEFLKKYNPNAKGAEQSEARILAKLETHKLEEMLIENEESNLVMAHPWNVMNAAQRMISMVNLGGIEEIADPDTGAGKVKLYKFFSGGSPFTGTQRIIGHRGVIESFVSKTGLLAQGHKSGRLPVMFIGGPGTGKSEIMDLFRNGLIRATLNDPKLFTYSYEWLVDDLPELHRYVPIPEAGSTQVRSIKCPIHDSPLVVLPEALQDAVLTMAKPAVEKLIDQAPLPKRDMCPKCQHIHDTIVQHYAAQQGRALTPTEVYETLNKHVRVRRVILGENGTAPFIPAQGKDVKWEQLFVSIEPVEMLNPGAKTHPMSYDYSGAISGGNGSVVFLDEVGKYRPELRAKLLTTIQSRLLQEGGAPPLSIDTVFILATNTKDRNEMREEDPQSPFLDRVQELFMNWPVNPEEVASILPLEIGSFWMTKLGDDAAQPMPVKDHLDELFPLRRPMEPVMGSDRRYDLQIGKGEKRVHVSPHAMMFLSQIAALSRMSFDPKPAEKYGTFPIVAAPVYTDPVSRIKAYMGLIPVTESQMVELRRLSDLSNEGTFGITSRDISKSWMPEAIKEASKADNGYCITPFLLKKVLEKLATKRTIGGTDEERVRFLNVANLVAENLTIPELRKDISNAITGSDEGAASQIHDELLQEIRAIDADPQAKTYVSRTTNQPTAIKQQRLGEITGIYRKQTGRDLSFHEISRFAYEMMERRMQAPEKFNEERHPDVMNAVGEWLAAKMAAAHDATIQKVINIASGRVQGSADERAMVEDLARRLKKQFGYCPHCMNKALELIGEHPENAGVAPGNGQ